MTQLRRTSWLVGLLLLQVAALGGPAQAARARDADTERATAKRPAARATMRAAREEERERDDATARREWQRQWYGEGKGFTAEYRKFLHQAAARERARWPAQLRRGNDTGFVNPDGTVTSDLTAPATTSLAAGAGSTWVNIGPTRSDHAQNGSTNMTTPDGGRPVAIVPHPTDANTLYVAMSGGGVWKTTTATAATPTWTPITETLGSLSSGFLAIDRVDPQVLYYGLGDAFDGTGIGLVKTADGGATWSAPVYLGASTVINDIVISSVSNAVVLVGTNDGLYRSTDFGANFAKVAIATGQTATPTVWKLAATGAGKWVLSLEANPAAASGTTDGQVWTSADDGASWTRGTGMTKTTGVGRISVASAPTSPSTVYAMAAIPNASSSSDLADLFRSTNGGASWTALGATGRKVRYTNTNTESTSPATVLNGQGWYNHALIVSKSTASTFFFGGALLLARATNATATPSYTQMTNWLAQFALPYVHADFHCAAYDAAGNLWVGTDGGVFVSANDGVSWAGKNVGITSHLVYSVGSSPANTSAVIGGLQDNGTRVRSGSTSTFNQEIGGDGFGSHVHQLNASTMLGSLYYTRIYKSTNALVADPTFASASSGILESNNSSAAPFNTKLVAWDGDSTGNTVYTHVNLKVYKSTNYAGSWAALGTSGLPTSGNIRGIGVAKSNGSVVGTVWNGGRVFLSSNGGASWALAGTLPNNDLSLSYVSFDPANAARIYVASVAPNQNASHLWRSEDSGATWTAIDGGGFPAGIPVNSIVADPVTAGTLFAGTHLGMYKSTDYGATWTRFGSGMPLVNVTDFYISGSGALVRASTFGRGFWELQ